MKKININLEEKPEILSKLLQLEKDKEFEEILHFFENNNRYISLNLRLIRDRAYFKVHKKKFVEDDTFSTVLKNENYDIVDKSWSAIITLWKREGYLQEQLDAIRGQSIPPEEIILIVNEHHISIDKIKSIAGDDVKIIASDINSLYTRWALAYIAKGTYVSVFDDDVIPGRNWMTNAIRACFRYNALVGPSGRIYNPHGMHNYFNTVNKDASTNHQISCSDVDVFCDWVCNSYVFKREWVGYVLSDIRYNESYKTFDDIQLATSLFIHGGIKCVTPMQPHFDKSFHGSLKSDYGKDHVAIWKTNSSKHFSDRKDYIESLIDQGYIPINKRENLFRFHFIVPFGERETLERCVLSVVGQNYENYTCTLIDDCCDGVNALHLLEIEKCDKSKFRYLQAKEKLYPLKSREIATDLLYANPADVIIHLDGDDWLASPDVLSTLNSIYRKGNIHATYGNCVDYKINRKDDSFEYTFRDMSKRWNLYEEENINSEVYPFTALQKKDINETWGKAAWCNMHLRSFSVAKWYAINRDTFVNSDGDYHKVATDSAIFIPILDLCKFESVSFIPKVLYVYYNGKNTIHYKNEILKIEKLQTKKNITYAERSQNFEQLHNLLNNIYKKNDVDEICILHEGGNVTKNLFIINNVNKLEHYDSVSSLVTIITPDYLSDAVVSLKSYDYYEKSLSKKYIFISTEDTKEIATCKALLDNSDFNIIFPHTLKHTKKKSQALAQKYTLGSDEYRWGMKSILLMELLLEKNSLVIFLDPDMYTVSDISDMHRELFNYDISLFPHFRSYDVTAARNILYKDGFFNGGMLAATTSGLKHIEKLYERCLAILKKDKSSDLWDDQKYFDAFVCEVQNLYINLDRGIDYNPWNWEFAEGFITTSQQSFVLMSGFFVKVWHMSSALITNAIDYNNEKYTKCRLIVSMYLFSLLYSNALLIIKEYSIFQNTSTNLLNRFDALITKITALSPAISTNVLQEIVNKIRQEEALSVNDALENWTYSLLESICYDNFGMFAQLLEALFPNSNNTKLLAEKLRFNDLNYITNWISAQNTNSVDIEEFFNEYNAGEIVKKQINTFKKSKI